MSTKFSIRTNILTPLTEQTYELKPNHIIYVENGKIENILPVSKGNDYDIDLRNTIAIPGLIDIHVHLSQYRIRGHYRESLLPWLSDVVFPEERKSADYEYAYNLAEDFFRALYKAGTTTAVIYTAPFLTSCETAFEAAKLQNFRAFIGMSLMNQNSPETLIQNTKQAMEDCQTLINEYHDPDNGLQFIFTPRFAPTCSMELMQWIGEFARKHNIWIQTHLSENKDEIKWVKDLFGLESYTDVYEKAGILTDKTILAHCIHLSDPELSKLKTNGCKIAHCPESNFFLHSGRFPLIRVHEKELSFALGSDVGAGTSLNMLYHAKMYNFMQSTTPVSPADAFYRITLGAAKVLNLESKIGSLEVGKEADIVVLDLPDGNKHITEDIVSQLIFTGHEWNTTQVYSKGIRKV